MKHLLWIAALLLAACGGDDKPAKNPGEIDFAEGYKYLKNINVQEARMIYRKQSASRAEGAEGYWKLDLSGNETRLVFTDADGKSYDIGIGKIGKLSDRMLLIDPDPIRIMELLLKPGPDDAIGVPLFGFLAIADVETGKLYRWPRELTRYLGSSYDEWRITSRTDDAGNVYLSLGPDRGSLEETQIYKLDAADFTMSPLLPEGTYFTDFRVTGDGYVFYRHRHSDVSRVKCPGGRVVPLTGSGFSLGDAIYTAEQNGQIFRWESVGNNDLTQREVCSPPTDFIMEKLLLTGEASPRVLFACQCRQAPPAGSFWVVGFDGTGFSEPIALPERFREFNASNPDCLTTSRAWYVRSGNTLHKLSMQDCACREIAVADYEIQHLTADEEGPDLHFTGYRYADGKSVAGTITESDEVRIESEAKERIIDLIAIN